MITTSLYGDSTCTNELEIKGFRYSVVTLGMSTVIFSNIHTDLLSPRPTMDRKNVC